MVQLCSKEVTHLILKQLREAKGVTQQKLADDTGIERASIARYENGTRLPPYDKIVILADYFGVSTDMLMHGKDDNEALDNADVIVYREAVKNNPDLRVLFSAARNVSKEDLQTTIRILQGFKKTSKE